MKKVIIFSLVLCVVTGYSQDLGDTNDSNLEFSVFACIGRSTFKSNPSSPNSFASPEFRLGLNVSKPVNRFISAKTGLAGGVKVKTEALNKPG
ncbi:MAG: hypothetical protein KF860_14665 [Cyclobacteriaceae bacterium]|nr:hypothetical protein [Cyclobacteriaceae bacterium]